MYYKHKTGKSGEDLCVEHLTWHGYEILERNYRSPYGEIDIIAKHKHFLVFVEVKTRTKESIDHTQMSITYSKQQRITRTAMAFLVNFNDPEIQEYRFDVMIIKNKEVNHIINAFPAAETGDFFS
jgi:putative endonuclease